MAQDQSSGTPGIDRRSLIKKSAAAGALVWAAPSVASLSQAHATTTPGDGRFTNCYPRLGYKLIQTGANCDGYNNSQDRIDLGLPELNSACCDESSYGIVLAEPSCGSQCAADFFTPPGYPLPVNLTQVVAGQGSLKISFPGGCNAPAGFALYDPGNCNSAGQVDLRIVSGVECEDGTFWELSEVVRFNIPNCPLEADGVVQSTTIIDCSGPGCP